MNSDYRLYYFDFTCFLLHLYSLLLLGLRFDFRLNRSNFLNFLNNWLYYWRDIIFGFNIFFYFVCAVFPLCSRITFVRVYFKSVIFIYQGAILTDLNLLFGRFSRDSFIKGQWL